MMDLDTDTNQNKAFMYQDKNKSSTYGSLKSIECELEKNAKLDTNDLLAAVPCQLTKPTIGLSDSNENELTESSGYSDIESFVKSTSSHDLKKPGLCQYSKYRWLALAGVCYVNFVSNTSISLMTSFFTQEAFSHGLSETVIGLIYGCYAVVVSMFCPICGSLVPKIGTKTIFLAGQLTAGVCSFLFSQIFRVGSSNFYATLCFACRAVQALGCAAYFTGATVIVAQVWKENITFAMSVVEVFTGLGMICGPLLGGWLYEIGGFQFPFILIGALMFFGLLLNYVVIKQDQVTEAPGNFFRLLKNPGIVITTLFLSAMMAALDFNMPLLSVHMESLKDTSPVLVGVMFVILASSYALVTPVVGSLVKTRTAERSSFIIGGMLVTISYLLMGPSYVFSGIHWKKVTIWNISLSMVVLGVGESVATVAIFNDLTRSAISSGMNNDVGTSGVVGGLFFSSIFFGEFIGPVIGGALMENFNDFKVVSTIFSGALFIITFIAGSFYFVDWMKTRSNSTPLISRHERSKTDEKTPLLE